MTRAKICCTKNDKVELAPWWVPNERRTRVNIAGEFGVWRVRAAAVVYSCRAWLVDQSNVDKIKSMACSGCQAALKSGKGPKGTGRRTCNFFRRKGKARLGKQAYGGGAFRVRHERESHGATKRRCTTVFKNRLKLSSACPHPLLTFASVSPTLPLTFFG